MPEIKVTKENGGALITRPEAYFPTNGSLRMWTARLGILLRQVELCIASGVPGKVVRDLAVQHATDLLLVGRGKIQQHFGRLPSNAYAIARDAPCRVISF